MLWCSNFWKLVWKYHCPSDKRRWCFKSGTWRQFIFSYQRKNYTGLSETQLQICFSFTEFGASNPAFGYQFIQISEACLEVIDDEDKIKTVMNQLRREKGFPQLLTKWMNKMKNNANKTTEEENVEVIEKELEMHTLNINRRWWRSTWKCWPL